MTRRLRWIASFLLPLLILTLAGCCSASDRQIRADVREWMKNAPPEDSEDYAREFSTLADKYKIDLIPAILHEAVNATTPQERRRLCGPFQIAFADSTEPSTLIYQQCLKAIVDKDQFRSYLGCLGLAQWITRYTLEPDFSLKVVKDFEALTKNPHPWTRAYGYALLGNYAFLGELSDKKEYVSRLLKHAVNEDQSFIVRYAAVVTLQGAKGAESETIRYYLGLLETANSSRPPYIPAQIPSSRDALIKKLREILLSKQRQEVEAIYAMTFPFDAKRVDLKAYALTIAWQCDLQELIPEINALAPADDPFRELTPESNAPAAADDPIVNKEAEFVLKAFTWKNSGP